MQQTGQNQTGQKGRRVTHHEGSDSHSPRILGGLVAAVRPGRRTDATATCGATGVLLCLALMAAFTALVPSVALAGQARLFAGSFGEAGSTPADPYPLKQAGSIAVDDSTHDVYVADWPNHRVEKFDSSGHFLFMLGLDVNKSAVEEQATRKAEENICPAAGHPGDVCQVAQPGTGAGTFIDPAYLAVDNSSGASKGDLYVANTDAIPDEQTVEVTATGGTFTLSIEGEATVPLAFNAEPGPEVDPASVRGALRGLAKLPPVSVSGSPGKYTLVFFTETGDVPQLTCDGSALSGPGASCTVVTQAHGLVARQVEKLTAEGQPVTAWGEGGVLNAAGVSDPPAPFAGPFERIHGIAVDPSGNLWVSDGIGESLADRRVFEFQGDSSFLTGWTGELGELAVDASDNLYFQSSLVSEFGPTGSEIGVVAPSSHELQITAEGDKFQPSGEAVDAVDGDLYVAGVEHPFGEVAGRGIVKRYDSSCHPVITHEAPEPGCEPVESFGAGLIQPFIEDRLAIDASTESLYVGDNAHFIKFAFLTVPAVLTGKPVSPSETGASLSGTVDPSGVELDPGLQGCRFEWGETTAPYEHVVACDKSAAEIGSGSEPVEVDAAITGLQAGKTYHYRLVAGNANDVNPSIDEPSIGADLAFGPPLVETASVVSITDTSASLRAQVNPNDLDTHVRIEYGTEAGVYTQSTPLEDVGSAGSSQTASFKVSGLAPGVTYHYREVAENVLGEGPELAVGPDQTFTTQPAAGPLLPDERAWELVSPPDKRGATVEALRETGVIEAAAGGDAITYIANAPTEAEPPSNADGAVQVLSARTAAGWSSRDIPLPHSEAVGTPAGPNESDYVFFSTDLGVGIAQPKGAFNSAISPEASEEAPYQRADFSNSEANAICASDCYRPLVTAKPGYANVHVGLTFAQEGRCSSAVTCGPEFLGATPDASHMVLESNAGLVEGVSPGAQELYEWSGGRLGLVSALPASGSPAPISADVTLGAGNDARNAISADGSRVVWSERSSGDHLYMRDMAHEQTLRLDLNKGGSGSGKVAPIFQTASSDDSVIFFTDEQRLTPGAGAAPGAPDLYRCDVIMNEAEELECGLTNLSPANGAESAGVQGVFGSSEDGSYVYFLAKGVLTSAPNWRGEHAAPATCVEEEAFNPTSSCNLYVVHEGTTTFITSLSGADHFDWGSRLGSRPVRVSPNGQWLAFMSQRSLTGYDNRDVASGRPVAEVYLYGAASNELHCASCDPSGARPHGVLYQTLEVLGIFSGSGLSWVTGGLVAADVPPWTALNPTISRYQDRYLSDQGRLFFNAEDGLVPQDSNGTLDVYEYEPATVGSCTDLSVTFSARAGGCVGLISSGTSNHESAFLDASESGNDVFFLTTAQLSKRDSDTAYDVYDARVGGGEAEPVGPVECQGAACQSLVEPPIDFTPGSLIFSGPGNLAPLAQPAVTPTGHASKCVKGKRLSRGKCVKVKCAKGKRLRSRGRCVKAASTHKKKMKRASIERRSKS